MQLMRSIDVHTPAPGKVDATAQRWQRQHTRPRPDFWIFQKRDARGGNASISMTGTDRGRPCTQIHLVVVESRDLRLLKRRSCDPKFRDDLVDLGVEFDGLFGQKTG